MIQKEFQLLFETPFKLLSYINWSILNKIKATGNYSFIF